MKQVHKVPFREHKDLGDTRQNMTQVSTKLTQNEKKETIQEKNERTNNNVFVTTAWHTKAKALRSQAHITKTNNKQKQHTKNPNNKQYVCERRIDTVNNTEDNENERDGDSRHNCFSSLFCRMHESGNKHEQKEEERQRNRKR